MGNYQLIILSLLTLFSDIRQVLSYHVCQELKDRNDSILVVGKAQKPANFDALHVRDVRTVGDDPETGDYENSGGEDEKEAEFWILFITRKSRVFYIPTGAFDQKLHVLNLSYVLATETIEEFFPELQEEDPELYGANFDRGQMSMFAQGAESEPPSKIWRWNREFESEIEFFSGQIKRIETRRGGRPVTCPSTFQFDYYYEFLLKNSETQFRTRRYGQTNGSTLAFKIICASTEEKKLFFSKSDLGCSGNSVDWSSKSGFVVDNYLYLFDEFEVLIIPDEFLSGKKNNTVESYRYSIISPDDFFCGGLGFLNKLRVSAIPHLSELIYQNRTYIAAGIAVLFIIILCSGIVWYHCSGGKTSPKSEPSIESASDFEQVPITAAYDRKLDAPSRNLVSFSRENQRKKFTTRERSRANKPSEITKKLFDQLLVSSFSLKSLKSNVKDSHTNLLKTSEKLEVVKLESKSRKLPKQAKPEELVATLNKTKKATKSKKLSKDASKPKSSKPAKSKELSKSKKRSEVPAKPVEKSKKRSKEPSKSAKPVPKKEISTSSIGSKEPSKSVSKPREYSVSTKEPSRSAKSVSKKEDSIFSRKSREKSKSVSRNSKEPSKSVSRNSKEPSKSVSRNSKEPSKSVNSPPEYSRSVSKSKSDTKKQRKYSKLPEISKSKRNTSDQSTPVTKLGKVNKSSKTNG